MPHAIVGAHRIAYERAGNGPPLVLLHGIGSHARSWRHQLAGLADAFTLVAWDAPGFGGSADPEGDWAMADYALRLAGLLDYLGFDAVSLLGLSWGGVLAQEFYRHYPRRVRALLLADTNAGHGGLREDERRRRLDARVRALATMSPAELALARAPALLCQPAPPALLREVESIMAELHPAGYRSAAVALSLADTRDVLPQVRVPTLILCGEHDEVTPPAEAQQLQRAIPGARLVLIPGAGHVSNQQQPARFNAAVRSFLRDVSAGSAQGAAQGDRATGGFDIGTGDDEGLVEPTTAAASSARDSAAESTDDRYMVNALVRGLQVLSCFTAEAPSLSLAEVAARLGWSRTAPYRLVYTLQTLGFLIQDAQTKRYRLGPKVLKLGFEYLHGLQLPELAQPYLEHLRQETGASAHLAIQDGRDIVYIARVAARSISAINVNVGSRLPAHATSMGKVLLAYLAEAELEALLASAPLEPYTERTITESARLRQVLAEIRASGYVLSDQEFEPGIRSIAAPVFDSSGAVVAAINISAPALLLSDEQQVAPAIAAVRRTADELSLCLGQTVPGGAKAVAAAR